MELGRANSKDRRVVDLALTRRGDELSAGRLDGQKQLVNDTVVSVSLEMVKL